MWNEYYQPASVQEALRLLAELPAKTRLIAGATDLMLELDRGVRKGIQRVIDITRLPDLDGIQLDENDIIHLGPLVTHNAAVASTLLRERAFPLVAAAYQVGASQIRNRGTIAGNLITASPANDTITPLMALGAWVELTSLEGNRRVPLSEFYTGVRKTVMQPEEMLTEIAFPALKPSQRGTFIKLGLRRAQAISLANTAVTLEMESDQVRSACITLGAVAPTIIHAPEAEAFLAGKPLTEGNIVRAGELAGQSARPIDDLRGSAAYRQAMVKVLVARALRILRDGREKSDVPSDPVLLWGDVPVNGNVHNHQSKIVDRKSTVLYGPGHPIRTTINGKVFTFTSGFEKSLLRLLREDAGLIGTKEGCAEGECGACTVFLDGKAVMACLVPAARADGAEIVTIEGLSVTTLAGEITLHPVQAAFVADGAVQCGYCTPGFIMSAAKLLQEKPHPSRDEIAQAISGNLCRCTGYYKIVKAIEDSTTP
jgi:xanthine dehydrogenase iron-sulfur cluster and FAD-binding subunit A